MNDEQNICIRTTDNRLLSADFQRKQEELTIHAHIFRSRARIIDTFQGGIMWIIIFINHNILLAEAEVRSKQ